MAADAERIGERDLAERMRARALASGVLAGIVAAGGLAVLHGDSHHLYVRLFRGAALIGPALSLAAGLGTLALVAARRFEQARYSAALAVAAVIAGWALAQYPSLLPGLSVARAAAPEATLIALLIAIAVGALLLFPSLALLFGLLLSGRLDHGPAPAAAPTAPRLADLPRASATGLTGRLAAALALAGFGLLTLAEAPWAHLLGVLALLGFLVAGFAVVGPSELARAGPGEADARNDPGR